MLCIYFIYQICTAADVNHRDEFPLFLIQKQNRQMSRCSKTKHFNLAKGVCTAKSFDTLKCIPFSMNSATEMCLT